MIYIENIFICIAIPMLLSLFFTERRQRAFTVFVVGGMATCLLSAYVSSFFMNLYATNAVTAAIEITPVCEEVMKLLPILFYFLIFEPEKRQVRDASVALAIGFATFENVCYLTENGASELSFLLIRGISAGALHILCGILIGCGMAYVFYHRWLLLTGTVGLLGASIILHACYNLLITADGFWKYIGYFFPSLLILLLFLVRRLRPLDLITADAGTSGTVSNAAAASEAHMEKQNR